VGVEPTIRAAKDRIAGFEGREGHRTPFASVLILLNLAYLRNLSNPPNSNCCPESTRSVQAQHPVGLL